MPEWIHQRAEHILAKNPDMKKSTAFAIATQQSHALGKTPKGYGTSEGKSEAKAKYDTPKDDEKAANPGDLKTPKLSDEPGRVWSGGKFVEKKASKEKDALGVGMLERAAATRGFQPGQLPIIKQFATAQAKLGPEAAREKAHRVIDFLKTQPKGGTPMPHSMPATPSQPNMSKVVTAAAERMKLAFAKISGTPPPLPAAAKAIKAAPAVAKALPKPKLHGEEGFQALMEGARAAKSNPFASMKLGAQTQSDVETKGSLENNVADTIKGTEHSQQGAGEQKGVPTEGYHWGQDPKDGQPRVGVRSSEYETFTDGAEEINAVDGPELLRRIFTNMGPASDTAKATIEQNFSRGRRGSYVTHSQTLLEQVRRVAGRA